jgi:hypothetical protein
MASITGLAQMPELLNLPPRKPNHLPVWLEVTVQEDDYLSDLTARVQAMAESLPVEILRIKRQRGQAAALLSGEARESLDELTRSMCLRADWPWRAWSPAAIGADRALSTGAARPPDESKSSGMRIPQTAPENLNSLKGEWHIDFTAAPFADNGLFAITGPTGRQVHLLDAICLAPHHAAPRHHQRQQRHHDAPHRRLPGRGGVRSQGVAYRAFWSQRRARGKPDGAALKPQGGAGTGGGRQHTHHPYQGQNPHR